MYVILLKLGSSGTLHKLCCSHAWELLNRLRLNTDYSAEFICYFYMLLILILIVVTVVLSS